MADLTPQIVGDIIKKNQSAYSSADSVKIGQAYINKYLNGATTTNSDLESAQGGGILAQGGPITQQFGNINPGVEKFSGGVNNGVDIGVPVGTKVATPQGSWKVVSAFGGDKTTGHLGDNTNSGYGNSVLLQNTDTGEKLRFSHLSNILGITPGQVLGGGKVFGATGATGNVTGPHLDLEYYNKLGQLGDVMKTAYGQGL